MALEFKLPDIGEGIAEGEIVKWIVKEGDAVKDDEPIVEVMTDKATVEITAPRAGSIAKILAAEGETIPVGSVIVVIDDGARRPRGRGRAGGAGREGRPRGPGRPRTRPRAPPPRRRRRLPHRRRRRLARFASARWRRRRRASARASSAST